MKTRKIVAPFALAIVLAVVVPATLRAATPDTSAVAAALDDFHDAASKADGARYFAHFAPDAVFLGTDATERWTLAEFRAFAEPYFSKGRGWTYTPKERHVTIGPDGSTAWFDEILWNEKYGTCRGSGVLLKIDGAWRIAQYNLSIPIPNDLAGDITERIRKATAE